MDFEHGIIGFKDRGDKNYVDENLSNHGIFKFSLNLAVFDSRDFNPRGL